MDKKVWGVLFCFGGLFLVVWIIFCSHIIDVGYKNPEQTTEMGVILVTGVLLLLGGGLGLITPTRKKNN